MMNDNPASWIVVITIVIILLIKWFKGVVISDAHEDRSSDEYRRKREIF